MFSQFETSITSLFGTRLPIIAGGMHWLSNAYYVAAVAKAGMMGFLSAGSFLEPGKLRDEIRRCRDLTEGLPFGVNVSMLPKPVEGDQTDRTIDQIIEEGVRFVETAGRSPEQYLPRLHAAGIKVLHKVPAVKYAVKAQSIGVDAVTVVGAECGGHPGMELIGTMVQSAVAARDIRIPFVVGGGIGTGSQIVAALAMGADGVIIGTRFLVAEEIWAHRSYKEHLVRTDESGTMLIMKSLRNTLRALRNDTAQAVLRLEQEHGGNLNLLMPHISSKVGRSAYETGDTTKGALATGQAVAFADRIEPMAAIVERLEHEMAMAMTRLNELSNCRTKLKTD